MSLKYHEGRAEQMLFQLSSVALERTACLSSVLSNASVRGPPGRPSRLELCPTPHSPGRFTRPLVTHAEVQGSQPAAHPACRTRAAAATGLHVQDPRTLVPLCMVFPRRRRRGFLLPLGGEGQLWVPAASGPATRPVPSAWWVRAEGEKTGLLGRPRGRRVGARRLPSGTRFCSGSIVPSLLALSLLLWEVGGVSEDLP